MQQCRNEEEERGGKKKGLIDARIPATPFVETLNGRVRAPAVNISSCDGRVGLLSVLVMAAMPYLPATPPPPSLLLSVDTRGGGGGGGGSGAVSVLVHDVQSGWGVSPSAPFVKNCALLSLHELLNNANPWHFGSASHLAAAASSHVEYPLPPQSSGAQSGSVLLSVQRPTPQRPFCFAPSLMQCFAEHVYPNLLMLENTLQLPPCGDGGDGGDGGGGGGGGGDGIGGAFGPHPCFANPHGEAPPLHALPHASVPLCGECLPLNDHMTTVPLGEIAVEGQCDL